MRPGIPCGLEVGTQKAAKSKFSTWIMVPRVVKAAWLAAEAGMEGGLPGHDKIMGAQFTVGDGGKGRHCGHVQGESIGSKNPKVKEKTS